MLRFDVRASRQGDVPTRGQVQPSDAVFAGLDVVLEGPVEIDGRLQATGPGAYLWRGEVRGRARRECRRCLTDLLIDFRADATAFFSSDPAAADDPGVYPLTEPVRFVDLSGAVREEVGLAVPTYALCRDDCAGLCPRCGADLNQGPCACRRSPETN